MRPHPAAYLGVGGLRRRPRSADHRATLAKLLEKRGLIKRRNDPLDSRRVHLSLTEEAFTKMRILMEHRLAGVT